MSPPRCCFLVVSSLFLWFIATRSPANDWPRWGGTATKNMGSEEKGLPVSLDVTKTQGMKLMSLVLVIEVQQVIGADRVQVFAAVSQHQVRLATCPFGNQTAFSAPST